jgi:hypothetical protein
MQSGEWIAAHPLRAAFAFRRAEVTFTQRYAIRITTSATIVASMAAHVLIAAV